MPTDDIKSIAEGLSEAQRDALRGKFSFRSIVEQEQGEAGLRLLGLWNYPPLDRKAVHTSLGLSVRAYLEKHNGK